MVDWSPELRQGLCDELAPDEWVEWQGVPDPLMGAAAKQLVMYGLRDGDVAYRLLTSPSSEAA